MEGFVPTTRPGLEKASGSLEAREQMFPIVVDGGAELNEVAGKGEWRMENGEGRRGETSVWSGDGGDDVMEERAHESEVAMRLPLWSRVI